MSPLNIHPEDAVNAPKKKKNKTLKVMLGIAALVAVPVVGTTLAASITIGTDNAAINFGQGVVQATACDSAITVTAASTFANAAYNSASPTTTGGSFELGDVTISGIASSCYAKKFTINVYPNTDPSVGYCVINNYSGADSASPAAVSPAAVCSTGTAGVEYQSTTGTGADGTLIIKFGEATSKIAASEVFKVTVETT
jgi:hypothetical protein